MVSSPGSALGSLLKIGWRNLILHPWQSILMILGIALGVAVVVAIDLANASASLAFDLSTEAVTGRATHQLVGGPGGISESLYTQILIEGFPADAAPVITQYITFPQLGNRPFELLGVDPFAEDPFRSYLNSKDSLPISQLTTFLTRPGAIMISEPVADIYGLRQGDSLTMEVNGQFQQVFLAGVLHARDRLSERALDGLVLADMATAQELTGKLGVLDRIDLILPEKGTPQFAHLEDRLQTLLPPGVQLVSVKTRQGAVEEMTAAFRLNLTALSLLALVVGLFLIYNTMTFSVVQRRPLFGTMRCLGITRAEIFIMVLGEAIAIGLLGSIFGLALGITMGHGAVRMVSQTINDLFFVLSVNEVQISISSLVKGGLLGVAATLLAVIPPAWEAATVPPRSALSRSFLEIKSHRAAVIAAGMGSILLLASTLILIFPSHSLVVSFIGTFTIIIGVALLAPAVTKIILLLLPSPLGKLMGTMGRLAPRDMVSALSRTSVAISALMVAVSVTIGVSLMVSSFRHTVITWLDQTLRGDIYLSSPSPLVNQSSTLLDPQVVEKVKNMPGVIRTDVLRSAMVDSPTGPVHIAATDNPTLTSERLFLATDGAPAEVETALQDGAVLVSEPFANRLGLPRRGGKVTIFTDRGLHGFPVAGIYHDYTSTQGTVLMKLNIYRRFWNDDGLTAVSVRVSPDIDISRLKGELEETLSPIQRLEIQPNRNLRQEIMEVFDRTFAITSALQLLATIVAFIGVLSALLSLQLDRQRELGILRAIGLTVRQLWGLVMIETGLMGTIAGLLSMPTGYILALILVYIINQRSFGWTLQMHLEVVPFIRALLVAISAALLAGAYPAQKISKILAAEALRLE